MVFLLSISDFDSINFTDMTMVGPDPHFPEDDDECGEEMSDFLWPYTSGSSFTRYGLSIHLLD